MTAKIPAERLRPYLGNAIERWGGRGKFAAAHSHLGVHEKMVWTVMSGKNEMITMDTADRLVTAIDPLLWHNELSDLLPGKQQPTRPNGRLRMSEVELRRLNELHVNGVTLHELGEHIWEQHGYTSAVSAASCLRQAFDRRCLPCYPRVKGSTRRRPNRRLTDDQVGAAWKMYQGGVSMGEMGRLLWQHYGYKNPEVCAKALSRYFRLRGLKGRRENLGGLIDDEMARKLADMYEQGFSCCELGRMFWQEIGYANAWSCGHSIRHRLRRDGIPMRPRGESIRLSNARNGSPLKGRMPAVVFGRRMKGAA